MLTNIKIGSLVWILTMRVAGEVVGEKEDGKWPVRVAQIDLSTGKSGVVVIKCSDDILEEIPEDRIVGRKKEEEK